MNSKIVFITLIGILFLGCKKNGTGGKAQLSGVVTYKGTGISSGTIYIKYGATSSPGSNPSNYDGQTNISSSGSYAFLNLQQGDYFLYAIGNHPTMWGGYTQVSGSTSAHITTTKTTTVTANISAQ
jgi:hypothetical protein